MSTWNSRKGNVVFSKDDDYYTPKDFVFKFGSFDYDPATTIEKAKEFNIENFDTIETNGLLKDWTVYKKIWINPPFTIKHLFCKKAVETYEAVKNEIFILVPIEFITTNRFHNTFTGGKVYVPNGRIKFESKSNPLAKSPNFGSVVIKIQDSWELSMLNIKQ